jgi:DegV family protein with EDD domain
MKKIAWVTDSTAFLSPELLEHPDVYVLNTTLHFNEKIYKDQDLTSEELYRLLKKEKGIPKTSQPPIGEFLELYEKLKDEYEHVIAVHVSGALSGTFSTSNQAADMVDFPIDVIDSKVISYPLTDILQRGIASAEQGAPYDDIKKGVKELVGAYETYVLIGSLDQLHKSGRMNVAQYLIGSLLNVKPIIKLNDGKLEVLEKVRTDKKAMKNVNSKLEDAMKQRTISKLFILHCNAEERAVAIKEELQQTYSNHDLSIHIAPLSSTVAVHTGEDTIALSWI